MTDIVYFSIAGILWIIALIVIVIWSIKDEVDDGETILAYFLLSLIVFAWPLLLIYVVVFSIIKLVKYIKK